MTLSKKLTLSLASMAVLGLLAACSNQKAQTPESSASTQQSSSKVSSSQSSEVSKQTEGLDGTYKELMKMIVLLLPSLEILELGKRTKQMARRKASL